MLARLVGSIRATAARRNGHDEAILPIGNCDSRKKAGKNLKDFSRGWGSKFAPGWAEMRLSGGARERRQVGVSQGDGVVASEAIALLDFSREALDVEDEFEVVGEALHRDV